VKLISTLGRFRIVPWLLLAWRISLFDNHQVYRLYYIELRISFPISTTIRSLWYLTAMLHVYQVSVSPSNVYHSVKTR
jgi:hypothetical protein